jgi:hypothetical protein
MKASPSSPPKGANFIANLFLSQKFQKIKPSKTTLTDFLSENLSSAKRVKVALLGKKKRRGEKNPPPLKNCRL